MILAKLARLAGLALAVCLAPALVAPAAAADIVPAAVGKILAKHKLSTKVTGLYVAWKSGKPLAMLNLDRPFNPASSIKLVTSMAALDILGPGHRWNAGLYAAAPIVEGSVRGDLYFHGEGDPYLTNQSLLHLVAGLHRRGISSVAGDLVVDESIFEIPSYDPAAFDGRGTRAYNGSPGAAVVNFGSTQVVISSQNGAVGAYLDPPSATFTLVNNLKLRRARCSGSWRARLKERLTRNDDGSAVLTLAGNYPSGCGEKSFFLLGQSNPAAHLAGAVIGQFEELGGEVAGSWRVEKMPRNAKRLVANSSRTLVEALWGMNKYSNNVMARNIFLSIGAKSELAPETLASARRAVEGWLKGYNIDTSGFFIDNGSGLSRTTRITPRQFGDALLRFVRTSYASELVASLAVLGRDGTARKWNASRDSAGNAHIKTGTLSNVRSTVGVVHNPASDIVFVMLVETRGTAAARRAIQDMLDWAYKQKPQ